MNIKEVQDWINGINKLDNEGDYENAHASEDALLEKFVRFVAGMDNEYSLEQAIAEEILKHIENSDAPRYTA